MAVGRVAGALVVSLLAAGCMHSARPTAHSPGITAAPVADSAQSLERTFAAAGIATVADETSTTPLVPVSGPEVLTLTRWQVDNISSEVADHDGVLGSDLDTVLPMPANSPQLADIVGGWAITKADPIATSAAALLGTPDWTHPDQVVFPTAVTALFAADLLQHVSRAEAQPTSGATPSTTSSEAPSSTPSETPSMTATPTPDESGTVSGAAYDVPAAAPVPASVVTAPCTTVAGFVDSVLDQVFSILHLDPAGVAAYLNGQVGGLAGAILSGLASFLVTFWNTAVRLARQALEAVVSQITAPILKAMATAIGGVAVFTMLRSYLKRWTTSVTPTPPSNMFGIAPAFNTGQFAVGIDRNADTSEWPPILVDCAKAANVPLPSLATAGSPVRWTLTGQEPGLVTHGALSGALDATLHESLDYRTGTEPASLARHGTLVSPTVTAAASVRRPEIEQLRQFVTSYLTGQVPGIVAPFVDPILTDYVERATRFLDTLTAVTGRSTIVVAHHVPKPVPGCTPNGNVVPAGTYAGAVKAGLKLDFRHGVPAVGGGVDQMSGTIRLHSDGRHVTGTIRLSGSGVAHAGLSGIMEAFDHSFGHLNGRIAGSANDPTVSGVLAGHDEIVGATSARFHAGLHVTSADCHEISGDLVPMWQDILRPVRRYLSLRGSGEWTIQRAG